MNEQSDWKLLPEIDGLRAIAVAPVLLFHFDSSLSPGGFIGVDIFFVLSGFLITAILKQDINANQFSLTKFYQRRIARIAPASLLVLIVTLPAAYLIYADQDLSSTGANSAYAAMSLANVKFMLQGNYFMISPDAQPTLHYWSLSVEEQFYLFFPIFLYAAVKYTKWPVLITTLTALVSFGLCIYLTEYNANWAFYLLPTRAWELLIGASAALLYLNFRPTLLRYSNFLGVLGMLLILISIFQIEENKHFPGAIAGAPAMATAMVLLGVGSSGLVNNLLKNRVFTYIGKRSYSLYLWHWPIYSMVDYQLFASGGSIRAILKVGLTVIAAILSYEFIEQPARRFFNQRNSRVYAFGGFAALSILVVIVGLWVRATYYLDANPNDLATGGIYRHYADGGKTLALIGDSEAAMYGTELAALARSKGYNLHVLAVPANNVLPNEPNTLWPQVERFVRQSKPDVIIMTEAWHSKIGRAATNLQQSLKVLKEIAPVILLTQAPEVPLESNRIGIRRGEKGPFFENPEKKANRLRANSLVAEQAAEGVIVIDIGPLFTNDDGSIQILSNRGRMLYHDPTHLSNYGAQIVISPLQKAIERAVGQ